MVAHSSYLSIVSQPSNFNSNEAVNDTLSPPVPSGGLTRSEEQPKRTANGKSKTSRPMSISIPPAKDFFRTSNSALPTAVPSSSRSNKDNNHAATSGSRSHRRTRSMTMPQAPGSSQSGSVDVGFARQGFFLQING